MKIPIKEIKEFIRRTSAIQTNGVMPILGYYLLDDGKLTKTNLGAFCRHTVTYTGEPLTVLLEEVAIDSMCNNTSEEELEITQDGSTITIRAGKQTQSFESLPVDDFPKFPSGIGEKTILTAPEILSLASAAKYVGTNSHNYNYIHCTDNDVFACNGFIMYHHTFSAVPTLILDSSAAAIIAQYNSITHYHNGVNIDFFDTGNTVYGFVRPEVSSPNYAAMVQGAKHSAGIKFDKQQIERFCQITLDITEKDKDLVCYFKDHSPTECLLHYQNTGTRRKNELTIQAEFKKEPIPDFGFEPRQMLTALRAIPYDYVFIVFEGNKAQLYTEDDPGYSGIVMASLN